jgi:hypothetical protein
MTEQFRPHPDNPKQKAPEAGAGPIGLPPPDPEQAPQGGGTTSPERQPLPSVWEVLERKVRLHAPDIEGRPSGQEYYRELREVNRSLDELYEKGTARDGLIQHLYNSKTMEPMGKLPVPVTSRALSLEEFQQFRSKIEPLSEEEIRTEIRTAQEEFERKKKAKPTPSFPTGGVISV